MQLPWSGPSREEIIGVTTDLIVRHGLFAHDEAIHLSEVARFIGASRNDQLYRMAATEIQLTFDLAWEKIRQRGTRRHFDYLSILNAQSATIRVQQPNAVPISHEYGNHFLSDVA